MSVNDDRVGADRHYKIVTFQGASDDCIEISGCPGADEFYVNELDFGLFLLLSESEGRVVVRVAYEGRFGVWSVGFMPVDEDVPIPPWPISWGDPMCTYTACIQVECPPDVTLVRCDKEGADDA